MLRSLVGSEMCIRDRFFLPNGCECVCRCACLCCSVAGFLPLHCWLFFLPNGCECVCRCACLCCSVAALHAGCFSAGWLCVWGSLCMSVLLCGCLSASAFRMCLLPKVLVCGGSLCAYVYCLHVMLLTCCVWLLACYVANMSLLFTRSVAHMLSC